MSATPRPWHINDRIKGKLYVEALSSFIADMQLDEAWDAIERVKVRADAALIVKAVNAYDTLKAENQALRELIEQQVNTMNTCPMGDLNYAGISWLHKAQAALGQVAPGEGERMKMDNINRNVARTEFGEDMYALLLKIDRALGILANDTPSLVDHDQYMFIRKHLSKFFQEVNEFTKVAPMREDI